LLQAIEQDIKRGYGVGLFDPHGDLYDAVLDRIPSRRKEDVVAIDFSDSERAPGLNFLELPPGDQEYAKSFIVAELLSIVERMYDVKTHGGPGFEQYFRNAVLLLLSLSGSTLLDLQSVFTNRDFREYLISKCGDPVVVEFWKMAEKTSGDQNLANWGPYITSKFGQFTQNQFVRNVIAQPSSTLDFRRVMDESQILLVKIPKGLVGEATSSFIGSVLFSKMQLAAMSRASLPQDKRKQFYLYIDEFQNFATPAISVVLSEGRKYGLSLTLAHQNFHQVAPSILDAIHGNVANKLFFRIGAKDAAEAEKDVRPSLTAQDLVTMPDFHFAGRLLINNFSAPPIVVSANRVVPTTSDARSQALRSQIIASSNEKYTRPVREIQASILKRLANR